MLYVEAGSQFLPPLFFTIVNILDLEFLNSFFVFVLCVFLCSLVAIFPFFLLLQFSLSSHQLKPST
ncbi:MAG: hypothetical protein A3F67_10680 [Verrucomicrobia bacterium RIFCSPHIGHO2_12_FULL_41_10]|nr:MAG: hypothetical protein A3F67_10680 [Verrucomicrobia bacterium RIFCSPHIGHO2_12_FULL_41_10]